MGTGKTTINRCLLEQLPHDTDIAIILNPALNAMELLATACDELGINYDPDKHSLKTLTDKLHSFLLENHARGRKTVLMIDEAQHLDFDVLEQIRLLTNLETNSEKLLQIILIGQPELAQMLAQPELRQLNQRITARYNLEPLNLDETGAYIHHRLQVAGMSPERVIFPASVVRGVYKHTRGIPRVINVLCDRILLGAYGRNKTRADRFTLNLAVREVLGDRAGGASRWRWPAALVVLLLVALGGWWLIDHYVRPGILEAPGHAAAAGPSSGADTTDAYARSPLPVPRPQPAPAALVAAIAQDEVQQAREEVTSQWLLPVGVSMTQLWALYSREPEPGNPCAGTVLDGVACVEGEAPTWDDVAGLDRPVSLDMVTPERFAAEVLLLGVSGRDAWVLTDRGVFRMSLAVLGPMWGGRYRFLWQPPEGFTQPLALGDDSEVVAAVAQLFARLDDQEQPLTARLFTPGLQQRVRLFQRQHGLDDDGVVGMQTLLKLNQQLGIDETAVEVRARLETVQENGEGQ